MKLSPQYEFSDEQYKAFRQALKLEYLTLAYLASVIALMYIVMGSSQTMKTAWIEDCLGIIPPMCFIIGSRICWKAPTKHYPYGFHRVVSILFLCAAIALLTMGAYLLGDSLWKLYQQEHPTIGMQEFLGQDIWLGWWMILVLLWGTFPPVILGHAKIKYAKMLNDKILSTDGKMNKADWMTAMAAIGGILGIGMGWWWADSLAAAFISVDIVRDGWSQTKDAVTGLINRQPTSVDHTFLSLPEQVEERLLQYPWIAKANVRLYEHGHLIFGEGFIETKDSLPVYPEQMRQVIQGVCEMDWRLHDFCLSVHPNV